MEHKPRRNPKELCLDNVSKKLTETRHMVSKLEREPEQLLSSLSRFR